MTPVSILLSLASFVVGVLTAIFAEPIRQRIFRPKLELTFENNDRFVTTTDEGDPPTHRARYIRVKATNLKARIAKDCRAYLIAVDRRGPTGSWDTTEFCDCLQLDWSAHPGASQSALDLSQDVPFFVDVVSTREKAISFAPALAFTPYRFQHLFSPPGTYRFTILVTGDNVKPARLSISFKCTGVWDQCEVAAV
jgi:hypothetical protein